MKYFKICVGQWIFNNIFFVLELTYYKTFLINMGSAFGGESRWVEVTGLLMQLYVFCLNIWSFLEFVSYVSYWYQGGDIGFSREEQIELLEQVARPFDPVKFTEHDDCIICLVPFEAKKSRLTVLPCDVRHYFHMECI